MNSKQLTEILVKHAPNMPLHTFNDIIKEWDEMRHDLGKYEYAILHALDMLGFNDNGRPTIMRELTEEQAHVLAIMTRVHAGHSCGFPGFDASMKKLRKRYPINRDGVQMIKDAYRSLENK